MDLMITSPMQCASPTGAGPHNAHVEGGKLLHSLMDSTSPSSTPTTTTAASFARRHRSPRRPSEFRFATIPDGLPPSDDDSTQDIPSLCRSTMTTCLPHFRKLLAELNDPLSGRPKVTCVVSDAVMSFTLDARRSSASPTSHLMEKGIVPLKDVGQLTDGSWCTSSCTDGAHPHASAVLLNTFDDFERPALEAMAAIVPPIYTIGPLSLLARRIPTPTQLRGLQPVKRAACLQCWKQKARSVVYVNFGSITVMTNQQLIEFAWGLANSEYEFLWIIRPTC
ncbi:7-deoxyloganetin glucosyltransferase [Ananas comosus]|uniref:7-deoxyloganetin glucosyltransferase n=1 Tax=Ananas comosus TaxID=4615 RepID=A0A199VFM5_ANACO|nr:7-deoxyloganetin glucosyltransferase [Ananas comosus]